MGDWWTALKIRTRTYQGGLIYVEEHGCINVNVNFNL